jgi:hypothetical protein
MINRAITAPIIYVVELFTTKKGLVMGTCIVSVISNQLKSDAKMQRYL